MIQKQDGSKMMKLANLRAVKSFMLTIYFSASHLIHRYLWGLFCLSLQNRVWLALWESIFQQSKTLPLQGSKALLVSWSLLVACNLVFWELNYFLCKWSIFGIWMLINCLLYTAVWLGELAVPLALLSMEIFETFMIDACSREKKYLMLDQIMVIERGYGKEKKTVYIIAHYEKCST